LVRMGGGEVEGAKKGGFRLRGGGRWGGGGPGGGLGRGKSEGSDVKVGWGGGTGVGVTGVVGPCPLVCWARCRTGPGAGSRPRQGRRSA